MREALCVHMFEVITSPDPEPHFLPQINRINVLGSNSRPFSVLPGWKNNRGRPLASWRYHASRWGHRRILAFVPVNQIFDFQETTSGCIVLDQTQLNMELKNREEENTGNLLTHQPVSYFFGRTMLLICNWDLIVAMTARMETSSVFVVPEGNRSDGSPTSIICSGVLNFCPQKRYKSCC